MKEITASNYFEASKGRFRVQPTSWAEKARQAVGGCTEVINPEGLRLRYYTNQKEIQLGNHLWRPICVSWSARYESLSAYWVDENEEMLLRLSDHWSASSNRNVNTIGFIRKCWWTLEGRSQPSAEKFHLGLISFKDMVPC